MKTISSRNIVQRVYTLFKPNNSNWEADAKDWIPQAVGFIGKSIGYKRRICTNVLVENYKTCYPVGLEGLIGIVYKGKALPFGTDLSGIGIQCSSKETNQLYSQDDLVELNKLQTQLDTLNKQYAITPTQEIADKIVFVADRILVLDKALSLYKTYNQGRINSNQGNYYNLNFDVIQTSFETGVIDIIFIGFEIDNEGWISVLDNEWYLEACAWYIMRCMMLNGYESKVFSSWKEVDDEWEKRRIRASNNPKIPSIDRMERLTRAIQRFKLDRDAYNHQFTGLEQKAGLTF